MKHFFLTFFVFMILVIAYPTVAGTKFSFSMPVNNLNLVAYWTFDTADINWNTNTASDSSGNGHTGFITNMSTSTSPIAGQIGEALTFDANNDYVVTQTTVIDPAATDFTVMAWINFGGSSTRTIFSQENGTGTGRTWLAIETGNALSTAFNNGSFNLDANTVPQAGVWVHVALVKTDTATLTFYQNGVSDGTISKTVESATGNFRIGINKSGSQVFSGGIDDARVYDRALSGTEIQQIFQGTGTTRRATIKSSLPKTIIRALSL